MEPIIVFVILQRYTGKCCGVFSKWNDVVRYYEQNEDIRTNPVYEYNADHNMALHRIEFEDGRWEEYPI